MSCFEAIQFLNITPVIIGLLVVLLWEINMFGSRQAGVIAVLIFVLLFLGYFFLRDWAKNDFYLSPRFQTIGNLLVVVGMSVSLAVGLIFDVSLLICLSMFFFLYIFRELMTICARRFVMEPDVPIFFSPYIFPVFSYSSRTHDLVDETKTAIRLYSAMVMTILWGITFAIFVNPQSLGVTVACVALICAVVITAVLIQRVPLAMGSASRFLDSAAILDASETARTSFDQRRKPIEFELAEMEEIDRANPLYSRTQGLTSTQERKTAAELANQIHAHVLSMRKTTNRRGEEKWHDNALYTFEDALAETLIAGKGPFAALGINKLWYRLLKCCKCSRLVKDYNTEGQRENVEKLKKKFDHESALLEIEESEKKLNHWYEQEMRCMIHLWLLMIVASDARLRREKVLFQKFLRENRFKLLSNGINPPKNIFSSASFASINIALVAVWLTTLTPEERERFHLLKTKFTEEQAMRDEMVDKANFAEQVAEEELGRRRRAREEEMCKRSFMEIQQKREQRLSKWVSGLPHEDQRRFSVNKAAWTKAIAPAKVLPEQETLYQSFQENVNVKVSGK